jgi:hypothetical protein
VVPVLLAGCTAGRQPLTGERVAVVFDRIGAPDAQVVLEDGRRVMTYEEPDGGWLVSSPCRRTLIVDDGVVTADQERCGR